jgi:hypothetical protein
MAWPNAIRQRTDSESHAQRYGNDAITTVSVDALLPADSPRQAGVDERHVEALAQAPDDLPPILVHRDTMRVIDGTHRLRAAMFLGCDAVRVEFFDGSEQAAFVAAVQANIAHGLPLTLGDRRAAAERLLREHPDWSDRAVAQIAGLAHKTVSAIRRSSEDFPQSNTRLGRDGRLRPTDSAERRSRARQLILDRPEASLREIARAVGLSPTTVLAIRDGVVDEADWSAPVRPPDQRAAEPSREPEPPNDRLRSLWEALLHDPELRFTDNGRALLRVLQVQAVTNPRNWDKLVCAVPPRHAGTVADLASQCARMWEDFANEMRRVEQRK